MRYKLGALAEVDTGEVQGVVKRGAAHDEGKPYDIISPCAPPAAVAALDGRPTAWGTPVPHRRLEKRRPVNSVWLVVVGVVLTTIIVYVWTVGLFRTPN